MKSASLLPTSASTVNSRERRSISSRLTSASSVIVPSEISTWRSPSSRSQAIEPVDAALADRDLGERAAEHDRDAAARRSARASGAGCRSPRAVPQPSLTMSTLSPATSSRPSTSAIESPGRSRG